VLSAAKFNTLGSQISNLLLATDALLIPQHGAWALQLP
jgi:hypothetical protein